MESFRKMNMLAMKMDFLNLAAELAERVDWRDVYPNPRVGCVIVRNGEILSTGVHEKYGAAHAEVKAVENPKLSNYKLQTTNRELEVFITLEPCDHFSGKKTGSCTQKLIELNPDKIVIGSLDERFCGKNVEKLRAAGIKVEVLNHKKSGDLSRVKPYIILKLAQTLDGRIGTPPRNLKYFSPPLDSRGGSSDYISSLESRKKVHQWRSEVDGILTTTGTILADDPLLDCRLLNKNIAQDLFVFGRSEILQDANIFKSLGRNIFRFEGKDLSHDLREIAEMGVKTLLTECGSHMATSLLQQDLVDEIRLFVAPKIFGKGVSVFAREIDLCRFKILDVEEVEGDLLVGFVKI